ncbi:head-tail adaptor protein [Streptomyces avermitilis]|uniref:head-tail adaptor protein n=1 Tax=Streptomyces avermitilis TaxID=33903 RepID=UPI00371E3304
MLLLPTHVVTILTRPEPTRDRQNNRITDWSTATRTSHKGRVQPLSSSETVQQGDQVITTLECFLPPSAAVTEYDRAEVDGVTYEVDGKPEVQTGHGPLALLAYKRVVLKQVTG